MNMRDLKELMLVTAGGAVGYVSSWNRTTVFVHFWDATSGCFESSPAGCARDRVEPGGSISWCGKLPDAKPRKKGEPEPESEPENVDGKDPFE